MRRSASRPALAATVAVLALVATSTLHAAAGPSADPVIVAVGDLACQSFPQGDGEGACRSDEIADLIRSIGPSRFLALGDLQYNKGSLGEFMKSYDLQFGDLKPITLPATGNHEYGTAGAADYFTYWGGRANPPLGYYSVNVGDWQTEMILRSSASTFATASGIRAAMSVGIVTAPCWSACTRSPGFTHSPPTLIGKPKSTMCT